MLIDNLIYVTNTLIFITKYEKYVKRWRERRTAPSGQVAKWPSGISPAAAGEAVSPTRDGGVIFRNALSQYGNDQSRH